VNPEAYWAKTYKISDYQDMKVGLYSNRGDKMNRKKGMLLIIGLILAVMPLLFRGIRYSPESALTGTSPVRILFIGNSLTFQNNLPEVFAELAQSGGYDVEVDMSAYGGWTLSDHAASPLTRDKIELKWDFVILQEQSVIPCMASEREQYMYPAVRTLYSMITDKGSTPILFMTWGRRNGFPDAGYSTFNKMQAEIYSGYMAIGDELDILVAPVGSAWLRALEKDVQLNLWETDGIHPSREGTYLSACVFYTTIFRQSPEGLLYTAGLSEEIAQVLQAAAAETVLQSSTGMI
jgi:hypothetical protein